MCIYTYIYTASSETSFDDQADVASGVNVQALPLRMHGDRTEQSNVAPPPDLRNSGKRTMLTPFTTHLTAETPSVHKICVHGENTYIRGDPDSLHTSMESTHKCRTPSQRADGQTGTSWATSSGLATGRSNSDFKSPLFSSSWKRHEYIG